jgi:hypothetical protein
MTGGGYTFIQQGTGTPIVRSNFPSAPNDWFVSVWNVTNGISLVTYRAYALCAK